MFFWDFKAAIQYLGKNRLSARECLNYMIADGALALFWSFVEANLGLQQSAAASPSAATFMGTLIGNLIGGAIGLAILQSYYKSNGGDEGENLLENLLALHWLIAVRLSIVLLPVWAVFTVIQNQDFSGNIPILLGCLVFVLATLVWAFMAINSALRKIRAIRTAEVVGST